MISAHLTDTEEGERALPCFQEPSAPPVSRDGGSDDSFEDRWRKLTPGGRLKRGRVTGGHPNPLSILRIGDRDLEQSWPYKDEREARGPLADALNCGPDRHVRNPCRRTTRLLSIETSLYPRAGRTPTSTRSEGRFVPTWRCRRAALCNSWCLRRWRAETPGLSTKS